MEQISDIPEILPIWPSKSALVYPTAAAMLQVEYEASIRLLDDIKDTHRLLVVAAQKSPEKEPTRLTDLFRVGTVARLAQVRSIGAGKREIFVLGLERVVIGNAVQEQPYMLARVALKADLAMPGEVQKDEIDEVIASFQTLIARSRRMPIHEVTPDFEHKSFREIVYIMAFFSGMNLEHGQQMLEFDTVKARLVSLKEYLISELERFDQEWQAARKRLENKRQATSKFETALDALHTAVTLKDTLQVLKREKSLLLKKQARDVLRSRIAQIRQQKASRPWLFLLERDLDLLEDASKHGMHIAEQHLAAYIKMLQNQQPLFEAVKVLTMIDFNDPQTIKNVVEKQKTEPFSPKTFNSLYALSELMEDAELREELQRLLHFLEDMQEVKEEEDVSRIINKFNPAFESEIEHATDVLEQYLTSATFEEAHQTLKQNQEILLSDLVHEMLEHHIAERHMDGDHKSAERLETHLYLFDDARKRGIEAAWQTFMEDD